MPKSYNTRSLGTSNRSGIAIYTSSSRTNRGSISRVYNTGTPLQQSAIINNILIKSGSTPPPINIVILAVSSSEQEVTVSFNCTGLSSTLTTSDINVEIMDTNSRFKNYFVQTISNIIPPSSSAPYYQLRFIVGTTSKYVSPITLANGSIYSVKIVSNGLLVSPCIPFTFTAGTPVITNIQLAPPSSNSVLLNGFTVSDGSTITEFIYQITNLSNSNDTVKTGNYTGSPSFPYLIPEEGNLKHNSTYSLAISGQNEYGFGCFFPTTTFTTTTS